MACSRRCSAGASSAPIWNAPRSASASRIRASSDSCPTALGDRIGLPASSRRNCSSGARSSGFRSCSSAARYAPTSLIDSLARRPCASMLCSTPSCSSSDSAVSACASVGPIAPQASRSSARGASFVPRLILRATHPGLWSRNRATCLAVQCSSSMSEHTTRASSSAVVVRGGALAASSKRLCSAAWTAGSTTIGTTVYPRSRQCDRRLNPSNTS
jgi:hypothetical protein